MSKPKIKAISASELDAKFDRGEDILPHLDIAKARRVSPRTKLLNLRLPEWLASALSHEASKRGVEIEALLKIWTVERLQQESAK